MAGRVDDPVGGRRAEVADGGDAVAVERDIAGAGRPPGPVDERAVADDDVVALRHGGPAPSTPTRRGERRRRGQRMFGRAWRRAVEKSMLYRMWSNLSARTGTAQATRARQARADKAPARAMLAHESSSEALMRPNSLPSSPHRHAGPAAVGPHPRRTRRRSRPRRGTHARDARRPRGPVLRGRARDDVLRPRRRRDHQPQAVALPGTRVPRPSGSRPERDGGVREPRDPLPRLRGGRDPGGGERRHVHACGAGTRGRARVVRLRHGELLQQPHDGLRRGRGAAHRGGDQGGGARDRGLRREPGDGAGARLRGHPRGTGGAHLDRLHLRRRDAGGPPAAGHARAAGAEARSGTSGT